MRLGIPAVEKGEQTAGRFWCLNRTVKNVFSPDIVSIGFVVNNVFALDGSAAKSCAAENTAGVLVNDDLSIFDIHRGCPCRAGIGAGSSRGRCVPIHLSGMRKVAYGIIGIQDNDIVHFGVADLRSDAATGKIKSGGRCPGMAD